jgi:uncharacterized repeat protein (TIGR01451 family)
MKRFPITVITVITAICLMPVVPAQASCGTSPSVTAAVASKALNTGVAQNYSYQLCFASNPDRYTVQVFKITMNSNGDETSRSGVTSEQITSISGRTSPITGTGSYTASVVGDYLVRVRYYAVGASQPEMVGEATWHVNPAPTPSPSPSPTPPAPAPAPSVPSDAPAPPQAQQTVQGVAERAVLALVKTADKPVVKTGQIAGFTVKVSNTSSVTAKNVIVCDKLPAKTQFVSGSPSPNFKGDTACFNAGNLASGKSATVKLRLRIDRTAHKGTITNNASATADNADNADAQAKVRIVSSKRRRVRAPVTG